MNYKELEDLVYNYVTKYHQGFIPSEISQLLETFNIKQESFNKALGYGFTCMSSPDKETIIYHRDVELGIRLCLEHREMKPHEWD